jgi:glycosyltransferase involved in cell wall biosynthesis
MKIAQVAPLYESVPPKAYGGTERVVSYLTEELVHMGHEVTLFASGDSLTEATLVPLCKRSLRLDPECGDQMAPHVLMLEKVAERADDFDLIHFHTDYFHFPVSRRLTCPAVTTLHGRLDIPSLRALYREFDDQALISISDAQRAPLSWVNWLGTVYHGLPLDLHNYREGPGDYLAFLGRISPEKRVDRAIRIAQRTGMNLKIAAKVDPADRKYYEGKIEPMLRQAGSQVEFLGEIGGRDKDEFLGRAYALLFPIDWPEPFGLVMIEAMACGTPVIAYRCGSVPEVMDDGVTGFVVDSLEQAVRAVGRIPELSRAKCRAVFEDRFSAPRMTRDYLQLYRRRLREQVRSKTRARLRPSMPRSGAAR